MLSEWCSRQHADCGLKRRLRGRQNVVERGDDSVDFSGDVQRALLAKLVEQCGLERFGITAEGCRDLLALYAKEIPGKLAQEFDALEKTGSADAARELRGRMEEPIAQLCARSLKVLGS